MKEHNYADKFWRFLNMSLFVVFMMVGCQMMINNKALVSAVWFMLAWRCITEYQETIKR